MGYALTRVRDLCIVYWHSYAVSKCKRLRTVLKDLLIAAAVLQGLSQAQAKEVEALSAKSERLTQLLREQRKRGKERDKKAAPMLSEVFALEQQLHAERALVGDLRLRLAALEASQALDGAFDDSNH